MRTLVVTVALVLALPGAALAHVERSAYWPDPAPDCTVSPCAGGAVPAARSLASSLNRSLPGATHIVCQKDSLTLVKRSVAQALKQGYDIRPTDHRTLSRRVARRLLKINRQLFRRCRHHEIQHAVNIAGNNDRVVIMPGLYTEPTSAAQPTHDPACDKYKVHNDTGAP